MALLGFLLSTLARHYLNPRQKSCTRLGPLKDAIPTELQRRGKRTCNCCLKMKKVSFPAYWAAVSGLSPGFEYRVRKCLRQKRSNPSCSKWLRLISKSAYPKKELILALFQIMLEIPPKNTFAWNEPFRDAILPVANAMKLFAGLYLRVCKYSAIF